MKRLAAVGSRLRHLRNVALISAFALFSIAAHSGTSVAESTELPFSFGKAVVMQLSAGQYEIRPGVGNRIRVTWEAKDAKDLRRVDVKIDATPAGARLTTRNAPRQNFRITIEVPPIADLHVRLAAGDLKIGAIQGSKNIESHAGDVEIEVGNPNDYSKVDASIRVGDLAAGPFGTFKSGMFRSMKWTGSGRYELHAHLGAGDLNLH